MKQRLRHLLFPLLLVVLVPVFATGILCYTFQDGVIHSVPFGVIDEDNSALSRTLVQTLAHNDIFDVVFYGDGAEELEAQLVQNQIVAGMIIPKDFSRDVTAGSSPSILLVYDGCQMSVVGISKVKLAEVLTTLRVAASIQILEGRLDLQPQEALLYAQPLSNTFRYLGNPEKSLLQLCCTRRRCQYCAAYHVYVPGGGHPQGGGESGASAAVLLIRQQPDHRSSALLRPADAGLRYAHAGRVEYHCPVELFQYAGHWQCGGHHPVITAGKAKGAGRTGGGGGDGHAVIQRLHLSGLGHAAFFQAVAEVIPFTHFARPCGMCCF